MIPILGIVAGIAIPLVVILTAHQRKMAELIHGKQADQQTLAPVVEELQALRHEVSLLKQRVDTQEIAMDDMSALVANAPVIPPSVKQDA